VDKTLNYKPDTKNVLINKLKNFICVQKNGTYAEFCNKISTSKMNNKKI